MRYKTLIIFFAVAAFFSSCGKKKMPQSNPKQPLSPEVNVTGDSAIYGLACEGCTDSVIVVLPNSGGDPVTYDILDAMRSHNIIGMPRIGDNLTVLLSEDKKSAKYVVDLNELEGSWCYKAMPKLRHAPLGMKDGDPKHSKERMPDSIFKSIMVPCECGFELFGDKTAKPIGRHKNNTTEGFNPVEYPKVKSYRAWRMFNGKIIFTISERDIPGMKKHKKTYDTAQIVMMRKDSLVLKIKNTTQGFYRRKTS